MYIDTGGTVMENYGPTMGILTTYIIGRGGNLAPVEPGWKYTVRVMPEKPSGF